jgi:hypothetical protein
MRSSAMARRFAAFSTSTLVGAAVLVFHTAAFAQQNPPTKNSPAKEKAAPSAPAATQAGPSKDSPAKDDADAAKDAKPAPTPEAGSNQQEPQAPPELPPGYAPPPGYRNAPPPQGYPQPPAEEPYYQGPYQHDEYYGPPPPPYGYPPPRYYRRYAPPPPVRYYPEPLSYRPFFFGFGVGVGGVAEYRYDIDSARSRVGIGYDLRFGFGLSPRWALVLAADGAAAYFQNLNLSETVFTIGPQFWATRKLYLRAGIGAASRTYESNSYYSDYYGDYYRDSWTDSGMGAVAAVGFEFMQSYHVSLAVEANGTVGYYSNKDTLSTFGINFVMNLF